MQNILPINFKRQVLSDNAGVMEPGGHPYNGYMEKAPLERGTFLVRKMTSKGYRSILRV